MGEEDLKALAADVQVPGEGIVADEAAMNEKM